MSKQIIRNGKLEASIGRNIAAGVFIVTTLKAVRAIRIQHIVPATEPVIAVQAGGTDARHKLIWLELQFCRVHALGHVIHGRLICLEGNRSVGLLNSGLRFYTQSSHFRICLIAHLRKRRKCAIHITEQRMLGKKVHCICGGHYTQQHIREAIFFGGLRTGQVRFRWCER